MKKFYILLAVLSSTACSYAQCTINPAVFGGATGGEIYPSAAHLPHIVPDSLYDQTVQGEIPDTMNMTVGGIFSVNVTIDSVRLDSINGLPNGINWIKNPNILPGGGFGCVEFTGTTTDSAGTYRTSAVGMIWVHLTVPLLGINKDTFQYGSLNRVAPFNNFYVVVDSALLPLSATINSRNICFGATNGTATVTASGGLPTAPYTYLWNTGATTYTITNLDTGTYSVTVTSGADTTIATTTIAGEPSPISLVTSTDSGSTGTNGEAWVAVSGGLPPYTYRWTGGHNTDTITGLAPGTYTVTVRDSFGCTARDTAIIANLGVGIIPVAEPAPQITLFPNPANNLINLVIESTQNFSTRIEAVDMTGRLVYSAPVTIAGHYSQVLNTSQFSAGIYTLQVNLGSQTVHQRFVVTH